MANARRQLASNRLSDRHKRLADAVALSLDPQWSGFVDFTEFRKGLSVDDTQWSALKASDAFLVQVDASRAELNTGTGITTLRRVMRLLAPAAVRRIASIIHDPDINPTLGLQAAKMVLEESGMANSVQPREVDTGTHFRLVIHLSGIGEQPEKVIDVTSAKRLSDVADAEYQEVPVSAAGGEDDE